MRKREPVKTENLPPFCSVHDFSAYLEIGEARLRREIASGRVPHLRFGRIIRIPTLAALEKLLQETE
jgi:hypothetical protein